MTDPVAPKYVDHPAPSAAMMVLLTLVLVALTTSIPSVTEEACRSGGSWAPVAIVGLSFLLICFYFWPLYATYYALSPAGLVVRYGPWNRRYDWSEFAAATWRRGVFATRIGWPSVTPCVRLTDAVALRRKGRAFGLYLTPNDSREFLKRVAELAPDLTREAIF
jgi:hypothetical protein